MMGNFYTHIAPAWLATMAGIAMLAMPPSSAAQSGKDAMVAMAQAPSPESSSTRAHTEAQSGTGPTVPRPCAEQTAEGPSGQSSAQRSGGRGEDTCVDPQAREEDKGKPRSVGAPDQNGLPGAGAAAGAGGSIDERTR
jgi:hypothetical protein